MAFFDLLFGSKLIICSNSSLIWFKFLQVEGASKFKGLVNQYFTRPFLFQLFRHLSAIYIVYIRFTLSLYQLISSRLSKKINPNEAFSI